MELFFRKPAFVKTAGKINLSDDFSTWSNELLAELYKEFPFLGRYSITIQLDGQEPALGYLYGKFIVVDPSAMPPATDPNRMGAVEHQEVPPPDAPQIRIPIIVEEGKLYSFDVFIDLDDKFKPLTEERVVNSLFSTSGFQAQSPAAETDTPGFMNDASEPPNAGQAYRRGDQTASNTKMASVMSPAVNIVLATVPYEERAAAAEALALVDDPAIQSFAYDIIAGEAPSEPAPLPDFLVIEKRATMYNVSGGKYGEYATASHELVGSSILSELTTAEKTQLLKTGAVLLSKPDIAPISIRAGSDLVKEAEEDAVYAMVDASGDAIRGAVFTKVVDLDNKPVDLKLVVTNKGASYQEKVAGIWCKGLDTDALGSEYPKGEGFFVYADGTVTTPITVNTTVIDSADKMVKAAMVSDWQGRSLTLTFDDVRRPVKVKTAQYMVPNTARFIPTGGKSPRIVSENPEVIKMASAGSADHVVKLASEGGRFFMFGPAVDESMSDADGLSYPEALYALGMLGTSGSDAAVKLASARKEPITFVSRYTMGEYNLEKSAAAPVWDIEIPTGIDFVKIAAEAPLQQRSVDSVLSLGFLTTENIQSYVDNIYEYEAVLSELAGLLVAARLGMPDVKEPVVLSAMRSVNKLVDMLKDLEARNNATAD